MILRNAAGLLLALSLFHLNVVEADRACSTHHEHAPAMVMSHEPTASHQHLGVSAAGGALDTSAPCDTPVQADCCQALASCSLQLGFRTEMASLRLDRDDNRIRSAVVFAPLSLIVPPDPPPPKG